MSEIHIADHKIELSGILQALRLKIIKTIWLIFSLILFRKLSRSVIKETAKAWRLLKHGSTYQRDAAPAVTTTSFQRVKNRMTNCLIAQNRKHVACRNTQRLAILVTTSMSVHLSPVSLLVLHCFRDGGFPQVPFEFYAINSLHFPLG